MRTMRKEAEGVEHLMLAPAQICTNTPRGSDSDSLVILPSPSVHPDRSHTAPAPSYFLSRALSLRPTSYVSITMQATRHHACSIQ